MRGLHLSRLCVAALSCLLAVFAASASASVDTSTRIFSPAFKTLKIFNPDNFMSPPVMRLSTSDRLVVTFDEIAEDNSYLQYRLLHCNADWQPSQLVESEYLDTFNIFDIEDYALASGTYVHYVNYRILLPAPGAEPMVSGNYLLQVFDRDEPEATLLQARFQVEEGAVRIDAGASSRTDRGLNTTFQQLSIVVDHGETRINNPYSDLQVEVLRNGEPDTRRIVRSPLRVAGSRIVYEHRPELVFDASNEYRRFETVRADYPGMGVDSTRYVGPGYHAWLTPDRSRHSGGYSYDVTQNGRFKIDEYNSSDPDLGADYIVTHFTLSMPEIADADVYVDGEFTHHRRDRAYRMEYDRDRRCYTLSLPLKQGSYNYQYVSLPRGASAASPSPIEGDRYETRNEYDICVWLRQPGARYDRLLGTAQVFNAP